MFLIFFVLIFDFLPLRWSLQVNYCQCNQAAEYKGHYLVASHRQPRHLHHHRPGRRHRLRGSKSRTDDSAPRIIEHPSDLVVRRDQPGTMNCRAEGTPEPTIEWYRNGELVNFSKGHNSLILEGSLFFLHIKGKSDEGIYTCAARNHLGTAVSRNASLTIAVLKDEFRQEPGDKRVTAGMPLVIDCSPPKGHPEPVVTWQKDGVPLDRNNSRYMFAGGRLSIARTLSSDAGVYMCVASNQAGERKSRGAVISILDLPYFTNKPVDKVEEPGSTVQLTCVVQGNPKPIVQWSKVQGALPIGRYAITNENTLCLQRVTVQDSGTYVCTARNKNGAVSASAQLVVQDPLDTGQIKQELSSVILHLDTVTLQNLSSVRLQWMASSLSRHTQGYSIFYRPHTPSGSDWEKWGDAPVTENMVVIPGLRRGQRYEFKVRPYGWTVQGADSNVRRVLIPEEVPGPAPQDINVTLVVGGNGSVIVSWAPPPQNGHGGNIKKYKIWCFANETLPYSNWTVGSGTHSLEIPPLPAGIRYRIQVSAMYDSDMGNLSNPKYIFIETLMMKEDAPDSTIPLDLLLQVVKHPAFIATVGGAIWLMLMVTVIYLCQRSSKRYRKKKHSGLYRFASEDTIIKHRMDTSDSPWLSNTWKSASCSRNYSSTTSMNSQLLWMENKDTADFHKSNISFERKSEGSRSQIIPLVPDSSMYGALYVDPPGKDLTTFQSSSPVRPPGMGISSKSGIPLGLYDHSLFLHCHGSANNLTHGAARNKIPGKPVVPVPPNVALKEPWSHNLKRELHHVNSAPLSPYLQTDSGSVPSVKSLEGNPAGKEYTKVMKTFSNPKILHYTTSLKVMDLLPYSSALPPPPAPPPEEDLNRGRQDKPISKMAAEVQSDSGPKPCQFSKKKSPPDSLLFRHTSSVSLSVHDDTVLTPDDVAHYLEFNEQEDRTRHPSESDSTLPRPFPASSNTYGYICSPSELAEGDAPDEDEDDLDLGELSSLKSYRKYCETPTSSISEYESSMAGSLVNGWGSVSEDNYTSARCSMVSSSDGSFLMDASFAKALAVAVDSFCLGITQSESMGADRISADFSPSASPLDGLLAVQNQGQDADLNSRKPKVSPLPVLDWNIDWMDELEAKYRHRSQTKPQYPFSKVEPYK
ncbi:roundabout homolog 4 isoform X2 [Hyla sarda]|uniref:roundabout homolog 4 isoform X2 n=1 Tax=Hyla sarda TaxID=327740 RepID=UPI0024C456FC|nr:roundabout homolog 4 isoform X2 [Hyla sarda]